MARRAMSIRHPRDLQNEPLACSGSTPWPPSRSRHRAQPPSSLGRKKLRLGAGTLAKIKASMRRACKQHAPRQHCQSAFPFQDAPCRKWCHSAISPDPGPGAGVLVAQLCYDTRQLRQSAGHRQRQRAAGHPDRMRPNGGGHHGQRPEPGRAKAKAKIMPPHQRCLPPGLRVSDALLLDVNAEADLGGSMNVRTTRWVDAPPAPRLSWC